MNSYLRFGEDSLRNAALFWTLLVLVGGLVFLGARVVAALKGRPLSPLLGVARMAAVLGALGGFVITLRTEPGPGARSGLALGGFSAAPWVAAVLLEGARQLLRRRGKGGRNVPRGGIDRPPGMV